MKVHEHYMSQRASLREAMQYDEEGDYPDGPDALSIEVERVVRIVLGTGGPHDEVQLTYNAHGELRHGEYLRVWGSVTEGTGTWPLTNEDAQEWADAYGIDGETP